MEKEEKKDSRQPKVETEETVESEQSAEVTPDKNIIKSDSTVVVGSSSSNRKSLTGIGTLLLGIAAILGLIINVIFYVYNAKNKEGSEWTSEKIIELVKVVKFENSSQVEKFLQQVEGSPSVMSTLF